jgi:hypothetical protein
MKATSVLAIAGSAFFVAMATAGPPIDPTPFDNTAGGQSRATAHSAAPIRAVYITGTLNQISGGAWSTEMRLHPYLDSNPFLVTTGRRMGGVSSSDPFTFTHPGATWNNLPLQGAYLFGNVGGAAAYSTGGDYDFRFRSGFGTAVSEIVDGWIYASTDYIAPQTMNLFDGPTMSQRPSSLTTLSSPGTYRYDTFSFFVSEAGVYSIAADYRADGHDGSGASGAGGWFDGWLNLYAGQSFNPADPLSNLIGTDDDELGAFTTGGLRASGMMLALEPGWYTAMATTFANNLNPANDFTVYVGQFTKLPAPGALALLGMAGLLGVRRRRD